MFREIYVINRMSERDFERFIAKVSHDGMLLVQLPWEFLALNFLYGTKHGCRLLCGMLTLRGSQAFVFTRISLQSPENGTN
jgi:hypothetical protein